MIIIILREAIKVENNNYDNVGFGSPLYVIISSIFLSFLLREESPGMETQRFTGDKDDLSIHRHQVGR